MAGPWQFDKAREQVGLGFDWTADTAMWLLVNRATWTPTENADHFVADVLAAGAVEPATSGDRQTVITPTVTLDDPGNRALWGAGDFTYPGVPNTSPFDTLVLFNFVTSDGDSWLIAAWDLGAQAGDGNPINVSITGGYVLAW